MTKVERDQAMERIRICAEAQRCSGCREKDKVIEGLVDILAEILNENGTHRPLWMLGTEKRVIAALAAAGRGGESKPYDPEAHSGMYP